MNKIIKYNLTISVLSISLFELEIIPNKYLIYFLYLNFLIFCFAINHTIIKIEEHLNQNKKDLVSFKENEYKKTTEDVKVLYQNQQLLLTLINAVRVRINNFYAKKSKDRTDRSVGFKKEPKLGEINQNDDSI